MPTSKSAEIRKAVKATRRALREGEDYMSACQYVVAYGAFERAERYAFQCKELICKDGKFETEEVDVA